MHVLSATQFFVTLGLSVLTTTLVSRALFLILRNWHVGIQKVAIANCVSFVICYLLFVLWCSTPSRIYWLAGHVTFAPQALWFLYDILHWSGDVNGTEQEEELDS